MSAQNNTQVIATVLVGVIVVAGLVGYSYYTMSSKLTSMSSQNASLGQQLTGLSQQVSNGNQQMSSLSQQVSTLQQRTLTVVTMTNTIVTVQTTTSVETTTQTSISAVPQSSLVITGDSYNNTTHTFTFQVQNNQNYIVYAQLSATLWGSTSFECNGQAGTFVSQVYTFAADAVTTTQLSLALGSYSGFCGGNPLSSIQMNFVIPQSTPVSLTYTFLVVPNYTFP